MPFKKLRLKMRWLFLSSLLLILGACNPFSPTSHLEKIQNRGDIIMGTINGPLTYSSDGSHYSGFDYELGREFAAYLHVKLSIKEYETLSELFTALDHNKIDFIGSGLTLTPKRAEKYRSSPPYYYVSQKLVYHKGTYRPRKVADINAPVSVLKDSSHEETLQSLSAEVPDLQIDTLPSEDQESLLRKVADKEIKFAIVDSSTLAQKQRYYPVLAEAFTISDKQAVAWLIKREQDDSVYSPMIEFIGNKYQDQSIVKLEEKYFGHVEHFDFVDMRTFLKRLKSILPKYENLFKKHATPEVDWRLLAAVSYQESHWNPNAKSPTGVRGMMMLTLDTADYIGIKNRLNAAQSIEGGAKYLSQLIKRLPDSIAENEKVWFALASYNIGYGHLMDARRITTMKKQDADSWSDVKENLALLHQKKWYKKTRYGYARGREAQHYVNNIRQYRKTLTWFIAARDKELAEKKALQDAKDKALAEKLAQQKAQQLALAKQQALKTPLSREVILQQAQQKTLAQEKTLQQAKHRTLEKQQALQQAKQKMLTEEKALQQAKERTLATEKALQQAKEKGLAEQKRQQEIQDRLLAELNKEKDKALVEQKRYQQAKDKAQQEQQRLQKEQEKALAAQKAYQQAKDQALYEQQELEKAKDTEPRLSEEKT